MFFADKKKTTTSINRTVTGADFLIARQLVHLC